MSQSPFRLRKSDVALFRRRLREKCFFWRRVTISMTAPDERDELLLKSNSDEPQTFKPPIGWRAVLEELGEKQHRVFSRLESRRYLDRPHAVWRPVFEELRNQPHPIFREADNSASLLTRLPSDVLELIASFLPYQSTLRMLATCQSLQRWLSPENLAELRRRDPSEVLKIEREMFQDLKDRWREGHITRWGMNNAVGLTHLPCYTCLRWLMHYIYFSSSQKWNDNGNRICVPCQVATSTRETRKRHSFDLAAFWAICAKCHRLMFRGRPQDAPPGYILSFNFRFCQHCAGVQGELLIQFEAEIDWGRRQLLRDEKGRQLQAKYHANPPPRKVKDPDALVHVLDSVTLTDMFELEE